MVRTKKERGEPASLFPIIEGEISVTEHSLELDESLLDRNRLTKDSLTVPYVLGSGKWIPRYVVK